MDLLASPTTTTTTTVVTTTTTTATTHITSPSSTTQTLQSPITTTLVTTETEATTTPRRESTRRKNLFIFRHIDLKKKSSIDHHFKFIDGRGELKPPSSYIGASSFNYSICFQKIREWRKLTDGQQRSEIVKYRNLPEAEKKQYLKNIKTLMNDRSMILLMEDDAQPVDSNDELEQRRGGENEIVQEEAISEIVAPRISNRVMENRALRRAQMNNEAVIEYVGLGSNSSTRKRVVEQERSLLVANKSKKRKSGERPGKASQGSDRLATKQKFLALKAAARYNDSATFESKTEAPRQLVLTMVLNEVRSTSADGGTLSFQNLKREKPEFIVSCNSKSDCKKMMKTFQEIFVRDENKNKKDEYDVSFLEADSEDGKLSTSVDNFIKNCKTERSSLSRKPLGVNTIIQNQMTSDLVTEFGR
jgi:hypothetical protein